MCMNNMSNENLKNAYNDNNVEHENDIRTSIRYEDVTNDKRSSLIRLVHEQEKFIKEAA